MIISAYCIGFFLWIEFTGTKLVLQSKVGLFNVVEASSYDATLLVLVSTSVRRNWKSLPDGRFLSRPSETLLRTLLLREFRLEDPTVATILQYWVQRYEDKMAKLINDVVNNKPQPSPNKRKRNISTKSSAVPLDQVLSHLNHLRTACGQTTFFALETMQESLQTAQNQCSETQKKKYSDLFALIEEEEEEEPAPEPQRKPKSNRGRKPKSRKKQESDSEEESSEVSAIYFFSL